MGNQKNTAGKRVFDDAYTFPQDSQDLADDIWAAWNVRPGTSVERQAFPTAQTKNGMLWVESDTGKIYRHDRARWRNTLSEDTDWQTITSFRNGFSSSTTTTDTVKVRCLNGVIYLKGGLMRATAPTAGVIAFGVPPRFRPGAQVRLAIRPDLGAHIIIETNGAVTITATTASPGPTGAGYVLNGTCFIAEN